jgi:hypothetical protein
MRRFGAFIAVLGFVVFLGIALLPTLSARPQLFPYICMVNCAAIFILCERTAARFLGIVGLTLALIAGVRLYQRNARFDARLQELVRQHPGETR